MTEEKPKYGWYVRDLIIGFNIVGFISLILFLIGLYFQGFWGLLLIITGISMMFVFLWPGIGMIAMHLVLFKMPSVVDKMDALNKIENPRILDVGCGTGRTALSIAKSLKNGGYLQGIDIYEKMAISGNALDTVLRNARLEKVDDKTSFQYGSATDIPFDDQTFDIVNVSSVLHEIHELKGQEKAIRELYRVLKPGGYLYCGEWNRKSPICIAFMGLCCFVFKPKTHWHILLEQNNFKGVIYKNMGGFGLFTARK